MKHLKRSSTLQGLAFPLDVTSDVPTQLLSPEPSRRNFLTTSTVAVGGLAFGAAFTAPACEKKNLSGWVTTIVSTFGEMKPLLPQLGLSQTIIDRVSGYIDKAVSIARTFDQAYRDGKFTDAATLFTSLSALITSIASELNVVDNRIVKLALVAVAIARIAIASLLQQQAAGQPQVMAEASRASAEGQKAINEIQRLANADISKLVGALP